MIRFENVSLSYGGKDVLAGVTLHASPGKHIALMGPSGCGKTSLLRLASGLLRPTGGSLVSHARRPACAFQEPRLLPWLTAEENVSAVLASGAASPGAALGWLDAVGLAGAADALPRELSGGMAQRVNLARALAYEGDLILLDEPLKELDAALRTDILDLLKKHTAGKTLLVTTHNPYVARTLADSIYTFRDMTFVPEEIK